MAIKGKTKRSQGRPVRRPATGPRIQNVERRLPWYRAPAFPATLAVIALLGTLIAAYSRVQEGWARDDVRRFTAALRTQTDQLPAVLGIKGEVEAITVGEVPAQSEFDGNPVNGVGGRVPMLASVRDSYAAAIGVYAEAANILQRAGEAPAKGELAKALVQQANGTAAQASAAMDAAANALARLYARYDLDLTRQLPGESAEAFGARYQAGTQQPQGVLPS